MKKDGFTTSFIVDQSPEEVFDAISRDVVLLQVQKKYPRYAEEKYGYT